MSIAPTLPPDGHPSRAVAGTAPPGLDLAALAAPFDTAQLHMAVPAADHAEGLFAWMQDPQVYAWLSRPSPPASVAEMRARFERWARRRPADDEWQLAWTVQLRDGGTCIGALDVNISAQGVASNVGYFFGRPWWGRGLTREAVGGLCAHLDRLGVTEQHAAVTLGNHASCRLLAGLGFVRTGLARDADVLRGEPVDDVLFVRRPPVRPA